MEDEIVVDDLAAEPPHAMAGQADRQLGVSTPQLAVSTRSRPETPPSLRMHLFSAGIN
jgi:hypothetical protein